MEVITTGTPSGLSPQISYITPNNALSYIVNYTGSGNETLTFFWFALGV
jgi:hypothetical protein